MVGSNICKVLERDYPDIEISKVKCDDLSAICMDKFDYIIHAAGYGQPQKFSKDKQRTIEINTHITDTLFELLKSGGKFLFVSSAEVYSGAKSPYKEIDIGTTTPQHPRACYIEGKRCGDAICMAYKEQGYDVKIARLALAYGPGTKKGDTRVLNQFIEQALTTGEIRMKDKGEAIRTYIYIDDAVRLLLDILFRGESDVYNVGGKSDTTIAELAQHIATITRATVDYGKEGDISAPDEVKLDLTKTLTEFPRNFVPLEEGLKRTIEYQKTLYV